MVMKILVLACLLSSLTAVAFAAVKEVKPHDGVWHVYDRTNSLEREEYYRNDQLHGTIKGFFPEGTLKSTTEYVQGKRQGPEIVFYKNGNIASEAQYLNNDLDGIMKRYYETGELERVTNYKIGNLDGRTDIYYQNQTLREGRNYKDGVLDGTVLTYGEDGMIKTEVSYRKGVLVSRKDYTKSVEVPATVPKKEAAAARPNAAAPALTLADKAK